MPARLLHSIHHQQPSFPPWRARIGRAAEWAVLDYLCARGFRIRNTNLRLGSLEVDIVARQGPLVVLVEVRSRGPGSLLSAFESIRGPKRRRLLQAKERLWRLIRDDLTVERLRVDVAAVHLGAPVTIEIAEAVV